MRRTFLYIMLGSMLTACGISRRTTYNSSPPQTTTPVAASVSTYSETQASLMQAYRDWKGTPYQLGGRSPDGVDCSSFVSIVFDTYFGMELPMFTRELLNSGRGVRRQLVRTGDLVFFKTGRKTMHVGILVEDGQFLHASTSEGVTLSNLYDDYWANRYLGARRVM